MKARESEMVTKLIDFFQEHKNSWYIQAIGFFVGAAIFFGIVVYLFGFGASLSSQSAEKSVIQLVNACYKRNNSPVRCKRITGLPANEKVILNGTYDLMAILDNGQTIKIQFIRKRNGLDDSILIREE